MEGMEENDNVKQVAFNGSLQQWSQWQLLDSILPTGGFAHSFGLEAAIQARLVSTPENLQQFVIHLLENTGSLLLPFVYSTNKSPNMQTWHKLDKILDAMMTNEVARKASTGQGSALMRVAATVFLEIPDFKTMRDFSLSSGNVCFHHAPIFGLVCGLLGLDGEASQRAYMFITTRDVISAATRLNLVGPLGAAVLQHRVSSVAEELLKKWMNRSVNEACQTSPLLDTIQGCSKSVPQSVIYLAFQYSPQKFIESMKLMAEDFATNKGISICPPLLRGYAECNSSLLLTDLEHLSVCRYITVPRDL